AGSAEGTRGRYSRGRGSESGAVSTRTDSRGVPPIQGRM
ncbi:MAG: hypothetical protein AVDCRST_MAG89-4528, partial [uncultured Gemmatimonadetes bacterium]